MRWLLVVGPIIGAALLFPAGAYTAGEFNLGVGIFSGIIGAVVGLLFVSPIYLTLRKDPRRESVDQATVLKLESDSPAAGIWNFRGTLVIDPATVVFPSRCIFTNEPIAELLPMAIYQATHSTIEAAIDLFGKEVKYEYLPVSRKWLEQRKQRAKMFRVITLILSLSLTVVGGFAVYLTKDERFANMIGLGIVGLIVGLAMPKLIGFNDSREIHSAYFTADHKIIISGVHPDFLKGLPVLKPGFLHGFLGIEQMVEALQGKQCT